MPQHYINNWWKKIICIVYLWKIWRWQDWQDNLFRTPHLILNIDRYLLFTKRLKNLICKHHLYGKILLITCKYYFVPMQEKLHSTLPWLLKSAFHWFFFCWCQEKHRDRWKKLHTHYTLSHKYYWVLVFRPPHFKKLIEIFWSQTLVSPKICKREIFAVFLRIFQITTVIFCKFERTIVVLSAHLDKNGQALHAQPM